MTESLQSLRHQLDDVDRQIAALFLHRMALSGEVARVKVGSGTPVHVPAREAEKLAALVGMAETQADKAALEALYRCIFHLSRERQAVLLENSL